MAKQKQRKGFAVMDPAKRREICSKGGKAAHRLGRAHEWDSESAREAGRKGGAKTASIPGYMAKLGQRGGFARLAKHGPPRGRQRGAA